MMAPATRVRPVVAVLALVGSIAASAAGCGPGTQSRVSAPGPRAPTAQTSSTQASPAAAAALPATITVGSRVWVKVAVATLWTSPTVARPVDAPALRAPVDIRGWLASMSTSVRLGLVGRVETQALYGDPLVVTRMSGSWLRVVAPGQRTSRDSRGYPGWVPSRQVTAQRPITAPQVATVITRTAWLRTASGTRVLEASLGTRLPVLSVGTTTVTVATPTHQQLRVTRGAVAIRARTAAALPATSSAVVATARRFLGVPYLWGARSGFAVDCSGFTSLVYAVHGRPIPRDADDQSWAGTGIARATRGGDLTFYGPRRAPTHVAMYIGGGMLIHAPSTGHPVMIVPSTSLSTPVRVRRVL